MSWWIPILLFASQAAAVDSSAALKAEERAVRYLSREVPSWFKGNGCYSCHNNGDAARALFVAARKGHRIPPSALADTLQWLRHPERWDKNKGDPAFSDKRLADVQFAAAASSAAQLGFMKDSEGIETAARRLIAAQDKNGSWPIGAGAQPGSPTTYGTVLATYLSWKTLSQSKLGQASRPISRAVQLLQRLEPRNLVDRAALLLFETEHSDMANEKARALVRSILATQTRTGGWGPFPDSPPEVFDTAIALIALSGIRKHEGVRDAIERGRAFLAAEQNVDGSWPETTRPSGGESYAQRISTTGWALLALLESRSTNAERQPYDTGG